MKRLLWVFAAVLLTQSATFGAKPALRTLCRSDERVLFSCPVRKGGKLVSLCASADLTERDGYLQYRFGRVGDVELEFPPDRRETQTRFRYAHYFRSQVERVAVSFESAGFTHTLFDGYEDDSPPMRRQQGVQVTPPGADGRDGHPPVPWHCR